MLLCGHTWRKADIKALIKALFRLFEGSIQAVKALQKRLHPEKGCYSGSIQALFRLYSGSIQALFRLSSGSLQALFRLYSGSIQALLRLLKSKHTWRKAP
jgi:hypothetical protein